MAKLTESEWKSAMLSCWAVRNWTLKGDRAQIANDLVDWAAEEWGGTVWHMGLRDFIDTVIERTDCATCGGYGGVPYNLGSQTCPCCKGTGIREKRKFK